MLGKNDYQLMKSINFEFLRSRWPELAGLGGFAEAYAHNDPIGAIGSLRAFCEQAVLFIHHELKLPKLFRPNLIDLLDHSAFQTAVPSVVLCKMHGLRIEGNHAIHGNRGNTTVALRLLKDAFDLGRWLYATFGKGTVESCPAFAQPPEGASKRPNGERKSGPSWSASQPRKPRCRSCLKTSTPNARAYNRRQPQQPTSRSH